MKIWLEDLDNFDKVKEHFDSTSRYGISCISMPLTDIDLNQLYTIISWHPNNFHITLLSKFNIIILTLHTMTLSYIMLTHIVCITFNSKFYVMKDIIFILWTRFARLTKITVVQASRYLYVRFVARTGDAMGMNMLSKVTHYTDLC